MFKKLLLILCLFFTLPSLAKELDLKEFQKITVLEQGRYKPLDSYARNLLLRFSGKAKLKDMSAIEWLIKVIFDSESVIDQPVFLINNPEILEAIELKPKKTRRYSYSELKPAFEALYQFATEAVIKEEKQRTDLDKEFIRIYSNLNTYHQSLDFLAFFYKYSKLASEEKTEEEIVDLAIQLYAWIEGHKELWEVMLLNEQTKDKLVLFNYISTAYYKQDQEFFDSSLNKLNKLVRDDLKTKSPKSNIEINYNKFNPLGNAKFLYGFAFLFTMLSFIYLAKVFQTIAFCFNCAAFVFHFYGLASRVIILERPPVTNLYETFIFVALISAILGFAIHRLQNKNLGLLLTSFVALLLLLISGKFASEGDSFQILIAVLDSNFWLSTHVICVTIGYAGVFMAGVVGHVDLLQRSLKQIARGSRLEARSPDGTSLQPQNDLCKIILAVLAFGLCFSFLGTMLGGIWADQSWGRFWGWDPKENGALLIVLWSTIVFHARLAGLIKEFGIAVCSVIGSMVVITSWFGINLLGVGLHSYGFTNGITTGLYAYYAFEIIFLLVILAIRYLWQGQGSR